MPEKHHPTAEERDERVKLPLPPEKAIEAILATGPHPADESDTPAVTDERPENGSEGSPGT